VFARPVTGAAVANRGSPNVEEPVLVDLEAYTLAHPLSGKEMSASRYLFGQVKAKKGVSESLEAAIADGASVH